MNNPTFASPREFDFTTLANYRAPERTEAARNRTWIDCASRFYSLGEYHIFAESSHRRSAGEIEFVRTSDDFTDEQHDAIRSLYSMPGIFPPTSEELATVAALNFDAVFRYSTISNRHGIAVVYGGNIVFLA